MGTNGASNGSLGDDHAVDVDDLRARLVDVADPSKAKDMAAYMKGHFIYLGCTAGDRRLASKALVRTAKGMDPDQLLICADRLWAEPEREFHYVGMDVVRAGAKNLRAEDLPAVRGLILATPWWDTVDSLAVHTVGTMVTNHPELVHDMDEWIEAPDDGDEMWLARTAILHQLMYKERTDVNRLFSYCEMRSESTEFFLRKAIGWALRQFARTDPDGVRAFVREHDASLSGLSKREALKHLK